MHSLFLGSGKIRLRQLKAADSVRLSQLANNKNIWENVRDFFPHPYTEENAIEFIELCSKENPQVTFAIEYNSNLAGVIGLVLQTDIYRLSAEIGYWIGQPFWNKGIASNAIKIIVDYGFNTLQLQRIFTGVFDFNKASQRILEKNGFVLEGIFKRAIIKNNKIIDEYRYGITHV
jgi:[ribosomal protein S5]-alanine N-acetyltransferase